MAFGHNALWWPLAAIFSICMYVWSHYIVFLIFLRRVIIDHLEHNSDRILFPIKRRLERNVRPKYDIYICMVFRSHIFYNLFLSKALPEMIVFQMGH